MLGYPQEGRRKSQGKRELSEKMISNIRILGWIGLELLAEGVGIEAVADPANRQDQLRIVVVALDLAAQAPD